MGYPTKYITPFRPVPGTLAEELTKLFYTLNNNTLTLALTSTIRSITRLTIIKNKLSKEVSTRYKILKAYYNFILNLLILLIKINNF